MLFLTHTFPALLSANRQRVFLSLSIMLMAFPVFSQGTTGAVDASVDTSVIERQHEQLIQQDELRRQKSQQQLQQGQDIFLQKNFEAESEESIGKKGRCFDIDSISVSGVTQFNGDDIQALLLPYQETCMGLGHINELVKSISNLYLQAGFVTSRGFIQPQNLSDGSLEILVIEGLLEALQANNQDFSQRQLEWAFPLKKGELLNLRDIEQGLEQLNRLKQNRATIDLQPGSKTGDTVLLVRNKKQESLSFSSNANNSGSESTGEWLVGSNLVWDNPLSVNDSLLISVNEATGGEDRSLSRSASLNYSIPYGYGLYSYSSNYFEYQQLVQGQSADFITHGSSFNQTFNANYIVDRGQKAKWSVLGSLTRKQSRNYIEDVFLDTSSRTLYLVDLGAKYTHASKKGTFSALLKWYRSVDWFGAKREIVSAEDDFQFDKYSADLNFYTQFSVFDKPLSLLSRVHLFYTPEDIIASEALSLGGQYSVRGFDGSSLLGYQGGYWSNDITYSHFFSSGSRLSVSLGVDAGASDTPDFEEHGSDWMTGATIGLQFAHRWGNINFNYAEALRVPGYLVGERDAIYASLQVSF